MWPVLLAPDQNGVRQFPDVCMHIRASLLSYFLAFGRHFAISIRRLERVELERTPRRCVKHFQVTLDNLRAPCTSLHDQKPLSRHPLKPPVAAPTNESAPYSPPTEMASNASSIHEQSAHARSRSKRHCNFYRGPLGRYQVPINMYTSERFSGLSPKHP